MSDPLSVAAGVIGILTAAAQISTLLIQFTKSSRGAPAQARHVLSEVHDISGTLSHLQSFLLGNEHIDRSRASLLKIDHIVTIMSDCVIAFSELKKFLDGLKTNDMDILDGMKWARKEAEITAIIERLQHHKASLSLMLSILTSNTIEEAKRAVDRMHTNVHMYYQEMSARLHALELRNAQQSGYPISMQEDVNSACNPSYIAELRPGSAAELVSALECDSKDHDYTKDLSQSWVYSRNAAFRMSTFSLDHYSTTWSCLSALSLSDVSNISVINLVITVEEVDNPQRLSQTGSNARNLRLSETPAPEVNWRLERPSIPDNISSPSAHQDARSAREHRCTSSDSSSNNASPTDPSLQWPINRVLMWLTDNGFSNAWRETFKILNIQGDDFLELSRKTSERDSFRFTMMYQLVYPRLARECSLNGTGWDQTRERNEGRRLRRLIRGLIDGTEAPSSSAASHNHAETSSMRTIKGPSEPTNRRSLTNKLSTPVDSAWTDARELVSEASPRETIEEINGTTYACHSCHKVSRFMLGFRNFPTRDQLIT